MKFGLYAPNYGAVLGYAAKLANLARLAEDSGWEGFFIWDHMLLKNRDPPEMVDPWIALTAMAISTNNIRLGTTITPIPRRRPWKLARETASLDQLTKGRLTLGVGLGHPPEIEYGAFGEQYDYKTLAQKLDEGLEILKHCWSGKRFSYTGQHYQLRNVQFLPAAYQKPHIPIWVAGQWPLVPPFQRATYYDGVIPLAKGFHTRLELADYQAIYDFIASRRPNMKNFDIIAVGITSGKQTQKEKAKIRALEDVGVTWWLEMLGSTASYDRLSHRIIAGPIT